MENSTEVSKQFDRTIIRMKSIPVYTKMATQPLFIRLGVGEELLALIETIEMTKGAGTFDAYIYHEEAQQPVCDALRILAKISSEKDAMFSDDPVFNENKENGMTFAGVVISKVSSNINVSLTIVNKFMDSIPAYQQESVDMSGIIISPYYVRIIISLVYSLAALYIKSAVPPFVLDAFPNILGKRI